MALRLVFALVSFHTTCIRASRVLVTLYALKLGAEPLTIGLLAATFAVFPVLLSWQAGRLSDRYGPRWLMLSAAAISTCGMLLPFFVPTLFAVFVAAALTGLAMTFYNLSLQNLVGRLSTSASRARNYRNYSMFISVANMIGPLLVGILIDRSGHEVTFLYVAGLLVVPIVLLAMWGGMLPRSRHEPGTAGSIRDTLGLNSSQPIVMTLMYSRSPEGRSGEALGLRFALDNGVRLAAPVIFGAVASALNLVAVFWISALMLGAGGVIAHFDAKKDSRQSKQL